MARVRGREVVVDLMDAVAKLQETSTQHAEQLEALASLSMGMAARLTGVEQQVTGLTHQFNGLTHQVNGLTHQVNGLAQHVSAIAQQLATVASHVEDLSGGFVQLRQRVTALEQDAQQLAEGFLNGAKLARSTEQQLGRFGMLLGQLADGSNSRIDQLEARVKKLERKAS